MEGPMAEESDLERFVEAQARQHDAAMAEIARGRKTSHWMWFVFPQLRGLGSSSTAHHYGIASLDEARAYLAHPVLGTRLADATRAVLASPTRSLGALFGSPDDMKFRSSMTLFAAASDDASPYAEAIAERCDGVLDARTLDLIGRRR